MWVANAITLHAALHHWQILIYVSLDQPALAFTGIMNVKRNRLGVPPSLQTGGQRIEVCGGEQMKGGSPLMGGQIKWKMREEKRRGWDTQRPALGHSPLAWLGGNATAHFMLCLCFCGRTKRNYGSRATAPPAATASRLPTASALIKTSLCVHRLTHAQVCVSRQRICGNERRRGKKSCPEQTEQSTMKHLCNTITALPLSPRSSIKTPDSRKNTCVCSSARFSLDSGCVCPNCLSLILPSLCMQELTFNLMGEMLTNILLLPL